MMKSGLLKLECIEDIYVNDFVGGGDAYDYCTKNGLQHKEYIKGKEYFCSEKEYNKEINKKYPQISIYSMKSLIQFAKLKRFKGKSLKYVADHAYNEYIGHFRQDPNKFKILNNNYDKI